MAIEDTRAKCLELAVEAIKARQVQDPRTTILETAKIFEDYVRKGETPKDTAEKPARRKSQF